MSSGFSYQKINRLLSRNDFDNLRVGSRRLKADFFTIFYKPNFLMSDSSRMGVSVSKKVGKAVFRNKLKRISRETFRTHGIVKNGIDFLIVFHPGIDQLGKDIIVQNLQKAFSKLVQIKQSFS